MTTAVPRVRIRSANAAPLRPDRDVVVYWMTSFRRTRSNFALDRAIEHCRALGKPLLVLEALRAGYRWANDRHHAFVLQGMNDNRAACEARGVAYLGYVEPTAGAGRGLLADLAARACTVVTDDWPCFFVPQMIESAAAQLDVRLEAVDGNGLYPMRATDRVFGRAVDLRRHLQREVPDHLDEAPAADPLARLSELPRFALPRTVTTRWPAATAKVLRADAAALAALPIDHSVAPSPILVGGPIAAGRCLARFIDGTFGRYADGRNDPDDDVASGLSPYLHFGHIGAHEVFAAIIAREGWTPARLAARASGQREGWWGMSAAAEAFVDQLVTWRELGFNLCCHRPTDYDRYQSLPDWAQRTLATHAADRREHLYSLEDFAASRTHDEIWNAAQTQLRVEGRMHNYLRMLWAKKVLEWTPSAPVAAEILIELNNRFAIDGRDPNSYSGIFWCFGRYDRPWAPERPVFGQVRFMSSENTRRKLRLRGFLQRYGSGAKQAPLPGLG